MAVGLEDLRDCAEALRLVAMVVDPFRVRRGPLTSCQRVPLGDAKEPVRKPALHRREASAGAERRTAEAGDFVSRGIRPKGEGENRRLERLLGRPVGLGVTKPRGFLLTWRVRRLRSQSWIDPIAFDREGQRRPRPPCPGRPPPASRRLDGAARPRAPATCVARASDGRLGSGPLRLPYVRPTWRVEEHTS